MGEQKKIVKEDVFEKKKNISDQPGYQKPNVVNQPGLSSNTQQNQEKIFASGGGGGNQFGGQTGFTGGKTEGFSSNLEPKVLKKDVDTKFGGQKDWKKTEVVRDSSGNVYEEKNIHKEHAKKLPTTKPMNTTVTEKKHIPSKRDSLSSSSSSSPSSPSSPKNRKGGKMHNAKEKIKQKLHIGSGDSSHNKKTY